MTITEGLIWSVGVGAKREISVNDIDPAVERFVERFNSAPTCIVVNEGFDAKAYTGDLDIITDKCVYANNHFIVAYN